MDFPRNLKYTKSHEWARRDGHKVTVGITEYAQKELSDVVYVELPATGQEVKKGRSCAVVESVKAAFDIYAPVTGKVTNVNSDLATNPALINTSPYLEGWFFEMELANEEEFLNLLDAEKYEGLIHESAS